MLWRRANSKGVWASVIGTMTVYIFCKLLLPIFWSIELPHAYLIAVYLPVSFVLMIVGSLLSARMSEEKLNAFYARVHTPVNTNRQEDRKNVQDAMDHPRKFDQDKLTKWPDLELLRPGKVDTVGFLVAWGCVAIILGAAVFLIKFGA